MKTIMALENKIYIIMILEKYEIGIKKKPSIRSFKSFR